MFDNRVSDLYLDMVIQVWKDWGKGWKRYVQEVKRIKVLSRDTELIHFSPLQVTSAGLGVVLSAPYYLDTMRYGPDWIKMYQTDPQDFIGTDEMKSRVLGGEVIGIYSKL